MTPLQRFITKANLKIENDMGNPTFTLITNSIATATGTYNLIPSVSEFERQLGTGGYELARMLTATVRKFNCDGSLVFTTYPTPQQKFTYNVDGGTYRIEKIHNSPEGAYLRIIAMGIARGI